MYPEVFKAKELFSDNEFHLNLFNATVANYFELNNPIRFNNFCYSIRELLREKLDMEAPDEEILKTYWYIDNERHKPTRADKIRYYIAKGLTDKTMPEGSKEELAEVLEDHKELLNVLNKYTHITDKSYGIELFEGDKWFRRVLKLLIGFINAINDLESNIKE
jgi:hypothetical protein